MSAEELKQLIAEKRQDLKIFGDCKRIGIFRGTADSTGLVLEIRKLEAKLAKLEKETK